MKLFPDIKSLSPVIQELPHELAREKNISLSVLRLDRIHRVISGNKLFKLYYYLCEAKKDPGKKIITFGGAWSNHLAATAAACKINNLSCIGIVRGEKPTALSATLQFCIDQGMQLEFIRRMEYRMEDNDVSKGHYLKKYDPAIIIPAGGFGEPGIKGAELIAGFYNNRSYSHICCAAGTGATICGLSRVSTENQFLAFNVLKHEGLEKQVSLFTKNSNYSVIHDYTFGGYAKRTDDLINFMNDLYNRLRIPTDFVYTGKMMFGVIDLIRKDKFPPGSKILCIHTGGLQGNNSLPKGMLNF